jgi:RNA processing factor Prp31
MDSTPRTPPRFVPTLTTVLDLPRQEIPQPAASAAPKSEARWTEADILRLEEQLLRRVMQRIEGSLEERVSEAISAAVRRNLDTMIPDLRQEIAATLRALAGEALAAELAENAAAESAVAMRASA